MIKETLLGGMRGFPDYCPRPEVCMDYVPCQTTWKQPAEPHRGVSLQELESTPSPSPVKWSIRRILSLYIGLIRIGINMVDMINSLCNEELN